MKTRIFIIIAIAFFAQNFALYLPLSVKETGAFARAQVPTQTGVPMPKGKFMRADLAKFAVLDSITHAAVPADFSVNATWNDSSIRFLNVQFPATVNAGATAYYLLTDNSGNVAGPGEMTVTQASGAITVVTGPLKFTVRAANFNVIDEAYVDLTGARNFDAAHRVIAPGNAGCVKVGTLTSAAATAALSLFLRTESRAVIRAELTLGSHNMLMYITAFRNKPYVQIIHNWYFNDASATAMFSLTDLSIRLMTEITGARSVTVSRGAADTVLSTAAGDGAELSFTTNDTYGIRNGTSTVATGKGMTATGVFEEKRVGWLHASASGRGIGAGIRFMWQMAPKLIELKPTGELIIGLYRYGSAAQVYYGGNGRTHTAVVSFGGNAGDMKEAYYAVTQPLYAVAPPVWYCGMTQCLAKNIVHNDPALFATDATLRGQFTQYFNKYKMVYQMFGHAYRRAPLLAVSISDLYHFIRFGNCTDQQQSCGGQHYSNNYYDFPHLAILGLIMGGAPEDLELAWIHNMHLMDLNLDNVSGDCKGCPGVDIWDGYQSCSPTWWGNANHWKAQSFFENWYLTGEPILKDFGIRACRMPMNSNFMGGEHRSTGHILEGLSAAYEATWDVSYRDRMRVYYLSTIDSRTTTPTNNYFQNGIVGEGLMYQTFADPAYTHAVDQLKNWGDFLVANQAEYVWGRDLIQCCWLLDGFSVLRDNYPSDTRYQVLADSIWNWYWANGQTNSTRAKFFNEQYRGPAHYLKFRLLNQNYLSNYPDYANLQGPIAAERTLAAVPLISLEAVPNPLRSSAVIVASGLRGPAGLFIYDLNGRMVCDASGRLKDGAFTWDAKGMASGVYVAVLKAESRRVEKKITVLK